MVAEIKQLAKKADEILLATDPDREGEAIAWHLAEILKRIPISNPKELPIMKLRKRQLKRHCNIREILIKI